MVAVFVIGAYAAVLYILAFQPTVPPLSPIDLYMRTLKAIGHLATWPLRQKPAPQNSETQTPTKDDIVLTPASPLLISSEDNAASSSPLIPISPAERCAAPWADPNDPTLFNLTLARAEIEQPTCPIPVEPSFLYQSATQPPRLGTGTGTWLLYSFVGMLSALIAWRIRRWRQSVGGPNRDNIQSVEPLTFGSPPAMTEWLPMVPDQLVWSDTPQVYEPNLLSSTWFVFRPRETDSSESDVQAASVPTPASEEANSASSSEALVAQVASMLSFASDDENASSSPKEPPTSSIALQDPVISANDGSANTSQQSVCSPQTFRAQTELDVQVASIPTPASEEANSASSSEALAAPVASTSSFASDDENASSSPKEPPASPIALQDSVISANDGSANTPQPSVCSPQTFRAQTEMDVQVASIPTPASEEANSASSLEALAAPVASTSSFASDDENASSSPKEPPASPIALQDPVISANDGSANTSQQSVCSPQTFRTQTEADLAARIDHFRDIYARSSPYIPTLSAESTDGTSTSTRLSIDSTPNSADTGTSSTALSTQPAAPELAHMSTALAEAIQNVIARGGTVEITGRRVNHVCDTTEFTVSTGLGTTILLSSGDTGGTAAVQPLVSDSAPGYLADGLFKPAAQTDPTHEEVNPIAVGEEPKPRCERSATQLAESERPSLDSMGDTTTLAASTGLGISAPSANVASPALLSLPPLSAATVAYGLRTDEFREHTDFPPEQTLPDQPAKLGDCEDIPLTSLGTSLAVSSKPDEDTDDETYQQLSVRELTTQFETCDGPQTLRTRNRTESAGAALIKTLHDAQLEEDARTSDMTQTGPVIIQGTVSKLRNHYDMGSRGSSPAL